MNDYFRDKGYELPSKLIRWARNCDEYLTVGRIPITCFKRWVTWEQMYDTSVGFLTYNFYWSYTLEVLRRWNTQEQENTDVLCHKIAGFANILAGNGGELRQSPTRHIVRDGLGG